MSNSKLFLVITTILLSMFMGFLLAEAQETDDNEKLQGIELLIPNGGSLRNTFSFPKEKDWYKFYAKKGVTYQIFTRPVKGYNFPEIVICLFSDPESSYIVRNLDIKYDGSAFIEWTSPSSDTYFLRVQSIDSNRYGETEAYTIQITSIDCQNANTIIHDVPDYSQLDFGNFGDCKTVAAACVLGYWDSHGYSLLVDSKPDRIEDVKRLVRGLNEAMLYSIEINPLRLFTDENVREGIEMYCNLAQFGNNYNFAVEYYPRPDFSKVIDEIDGNRPVMYGITGHSLWGNHWMVTVGYLRTETTDWTINHDNWSTTHKDIYVDWDEATDCIIGIHPGRRKFLITSYPDIYSVYQYIPYPMVFPWLETSSPIGFGTINTFGGVNNMSIPSWSYSLTGRNAKYSNQFNSTRTDGIGWLANPELYSEQRSIPDKVNLFSSYGYNNVTGYSNSIGYNDSIGYNNAEGNSSAPGNNNYISNFTNSIYGIYGGSDLNAYPFNHIPYHAPVAFFDSLFLLSSQMFFPTLGLVPYKVFSPFQSLSPGFLFF